MRIMGTRIPRTIPAVLALDTLACSPDSSRKDGEGIFQIVSSMKVFFIYKIAMSLNRIGIIVVEL